MLSYMPKDFIRRAGRVSTHRKNFWGVRLQNLRQTSGGH
jgi:hypothetical protein